MPKTKLFKATWRTNYGERVAIIEAIDKDQAYDLIKEDAWDDVNITELTLTNNPTVISIEGGGD